MKIALKESYLKWKKIDSRFNRIYANKGKILMDLYLAKVRKLREELAGAKAKELETFKKKYRLSSKDAIQILVELNYQKKKKEEKKLKKKNKEVKKSD